MKKKKVKPGYLVFRTNILNPGVIGYGDVFTEEALKKSCKTFIGKRVQLGQCGDFEIDKANTVGYVVDACWDPNYKYLECVFAINKDHPAIKTLSLIKENESRRSKETWEEVCMRHRQKWKTIKKRGRKK